MPWLLDHGARWPRSACLSLTQRLENHALDVLELLIVARYQPRQRASSLRSDNLSLKWIPALRREFVDERYRPGPMSSFVLRDPKLRTISIVLSGTRGPREHRRVRTRWSPADMS